MRHIALIASLALAIAVTSSAQAGWSVHIDNLTSTRPDGRVIDLSSKMGTGIKVVTIAPEGRDGLHEGDVITAVDGHPLVYVTDLVAYAKTHMQDPARLSVNRGNHNTDVTLAAGKLGALLNAQP